MSAKFTLAIVGAAFIASVASASAQIGAYSEPGFGYTPDRSAARPRQAHPTYRWVDPRTGQPYNLYSPAYNDRAPRPRTSER